MTRNCALLLLLLVLVLCGCAAPGVPTANKPTAPSNASARAPSDWLDWQAKRRESIAGTNGWTTLVGRYWLAEGTNFAGTYPTNHAVLPRDRAAASIGAFVRQGRLVRFEAAPGVVATVDGGPVRTVALLSDRDQPATVLRLGRLSFSVIERGERLGLRVRDPDAPARRQFRGLGYFAYDPAWRIQGRFEPFPAPRTLRVQDVTGGTQELISPGAVLFPLAGKEHRLDVVEESGEEDYFVIFRDRTAGDSTYAAGRFLYVAKPAPNTGSVWIDFNRAYTPPCGFTPFATCPLPPRQNWLPVAVPAGERKPQAHR